LVHAPYHSKAGKARQENGILGRDEFRVNEYDVSPLSGFNCKDPDAFSQLPLWATLWRPSGTFGDRHLAHYRNAHSLRQL
jgi:hypothetical protein